MVRVNDNHNAKATTGFKIQWDNSVVQKQLSSLCKLLILPLMTVVQWRAQIVLSQKYTMTKMKSIYLNEISVYKCFYEPLLIKFWIDDCWSFAATSENSSRLDDHLQFFVPGESANVVDNALLKKNGFQDIVDCFSAELIVHKLTNKFIVTFTDKSRAI